MRRFGEAKMTIIRLFLLGLAVLASAQSVAQQTTDWGVIPIDQETTISFASYDITRNFTDQYLFSLQGSGDASYAVTVTFNVCANGCGNPDLSYGVYDANGSLINNTGSAVLTAGDYSFQVKGTGIGSGNSVDYSGSMSFFVSAVPEPHDILLMLAGLSFLAWAVWRRRRSEAGPAGLFPSGHGAGAWAA